jgi:myosin-5
LIQRNVLKIQRAGRSYIIRKRERILHRAAYYIQGYFRMRWLSDMFQRMRRAIVQIQRRVRTFLAKKHAYNAKYSRYILPWEIEVNH